MIKTMLKYSSPSMVHHIFENVDSKIVLVPSLRGDGSQPGLNNSLVLKIVVGVRNDQILKVTALKFKSGVSFGVGSNLQISRENLQERRKFLSKKCHTWQKCSYS